MVLLYPGGNRRKSACTHNDTASTRSAVLRTLNIVMPPLTASPLFPTGLYPHGAYNVKPKTGRLKLIMLRVLCFTLHVWQARRRPVSTSPYWPCLALLYQQAFLRYTSWTCRTARGPG